MFLNQFLGIGKADNLKPSAEHYNEAARLQNLPVVIDWQKVDATILEAADLGHSALGLNFRPLDPGSLAIVRDSMASGNDDYANRVAEIAARKKSSLQLPLPRLDRPWLCPLRGIFLLNQGSISS